MIKLAQIINATLSFQKLSSFDLHIQFAYRVKRLTDILQHHCDFYDEKRNELLRKYGQEREHGQFTIPEENQQELQQALDELFNGEVDITFDKIKIPLSENIMLSSNDISFLMPFVEFVETE